MYRKTIFHLFPNIGFFTVIYTTGEITKLYLFGEMLKIPKIPKI